MIADHAAWLARSADRKQRIYDLERQIEEIRAEEDRDSPKLTKEEYDVLCGVRNNKPMIVHPDMLGTIQRLTNNTTRYTTVPVKGTGTFTFVKSLEDDIHCVDFANVRFPNIDAPTVMHKHEIRQLSTHPQLNKFEGNRCVDHQEITAALLCPLDA